MNVCYTGFWGAYSGMGEAARNFISALHSAGVDLTTEYVPNAAPSKELGDNYNLAKQLQGRNLDYQVKIIHITPDMVRKYMEPMKYHIFRQAWETDKMPAWWAWELNHSVDEIWTSGPHHKEIFEKSGIKIPIYTFPEPTVMPADFGPKLSINTSGSDDNREPFSGFLFYSVFEWIERKDPKSLLQAYWREFQGETKVGLLIKAYRERFTTEGFLSIVKDIANWKAELNQHHFPKVFLCARELSRRRISQVHSTGDCFVTSHRGEGWGIPIAEAMLAGKPVISTNLGGIHEHIPTGCFYPVNYQMTKVFNMDFAPHYASDQNWGQVDITDLRTKMRYVFNNPKEAKKTGLAAQQWAKEALSYKTIGEQMKARLEAIKL